MLQCWRNSFFRIKCFRSTKESLNWWLSRCEGWAKAHWWALWSRKWRSDEFYLVGDISQWINEVIGLPQQNWMGENQATNLVWEWQDPCRVRSQPCVLLIVVFSWLTFLFDVYFYITSFVWWSRRIFITSSSMQKSMHWGFLYLVHTATA